MEILIKCIHILAALFLVLVVLLQSGRGGGMGAAFGGASSQIFGGRGASTFLSRITTGAAIVFFMTSLTLSMLSSRHHSVVMDALPSAPKSKPAGGDAAKGSDAKATDANTVTTGGDEAVKAAKPKGEGSSDQPAKKPNAPSETPPGVPEPKH
jgi:preprotein translocase subunit SecG